MAAENVGAVSSVTVTVNVVVSTILSESVVVHVTVVSPNGNSCPDAGVHSTVTGRPELSVAVGLYVTATVEASGGSVAVRFMTPENAGVDWSFTGYCDCCSIFVSRVVRCGA